MASTASKYQIDVTANIGSVRNSYGERVRQTQVGTFSIYGADLADLMRRAAQHIDLFTVTDEDVKTDLRIQVYDMRNEDMGAVTLLTVQLSESPFSAAIASAKAHLALVPVPAESK